MPRQRSHIKVLAQKAKTLKDLRRKRASLLGSTDLENPYGETSGKNPATKSELGELEQGITPRCPGKSSGQAPAPPTAAARYGGTDFRKYVVYRYTFSCEATYTGVTAMWRVGMRRKEHRDPAVQQNAVLASWLTMERQHEFAIVGRYDTKTEAHAAEREFIAQASRPLNIKSASHSIHAEEMEQLPDQMKQIFVREKNSYQQYKEIHKDYHREYNRRWRAARIACDPTFLERQRECGRRVTRNWIKRLREEGKYEDWIKKRRKKRKTKAEIEANKRKSVEALKAKRDAESPEERESRLAVYRARREAKRAAMTPEERAARHKRHSDAVKRSYSRMTPDQRQARRNAIARGQRERLAKKKGNSAPG